MATLDLLDGAETDDVRAELDDPHPEVRRQALRTAASRPRGRPELLPDGARRADDEQASVRFEVALALGESDAPEAGRALATVLRRDGADPWMRAAALSSARPHAETILL